jgi:hypothetical protein
MVRYMLLFLFWNIVTPMKAQIEQCEVLKLTGAIVISEYLPCSRLDSCYVEGNHYIFFDGRTMPFIINASFNKFLINRYKTNTSIPECLSTIEEDPILDYLLYDYTYNLKYSKHERRNLEKRGQLLESTDIYKRLGKKKIYVVYSFDGEIAMYKMRRKIVLHKGFEDPIFILKSTKASKFAVLKKAESLRSLTLEEIHSMNLEKDENSYINIFAPE